MRRMRSRHLVAICVMLIGLCTACQTQPQNAQQLDQVQQRLTEVESRLDQLAADAETGGSENPLTATEQQLFQVAVTTHLLDSAGFHGMDEAINDEGIIEPQFLGTVQRAQRLLGATAWPSELEDDVGTLQETLNTLATTLDNDDVEAAGPAAADAHEQQHDLSHAVGEWLASQGVGAQGGHD